MNAKSFLVILLFLFWSLGSGWYYVSEVKKVYPNSTIEEEDKPAISFNINDAEPILSVKYEDFRKGLLARLGDSNSLKITGLYAADEINSTNFENLGIARATAVKNMLSGVGLERMTIAAEQVDSLSNINRFEGVAFRVFMRNEVYEETEFGAVIKDIDSLQETLDPKLDAYLTYISVEKGDKVMDVIGHSDDDGDEGENFQRALKSANLVREALIAKGVPAENIIANSKGQSEPIADNTTEDGRSKNRRIELLIN
jgi:outer membrane protein OmpA-like peptidoglycan-associated protein